MQNKEESESLQTEVRLLRNKLAAYQRMAIGNNKQITRIKFTLWFAIGAFVVITMSMCGLLIYYSWIIELTIRR